MNIPRKIRVFILCLICLTVAGQLQAEPVSIRLHLAITEAAGASPPEIIDNHLVLTYKGNRHYRFVGAAFKHEDFKIIHPFYVNTNGVYILTYPLEKGINELDYRLVVDGLWMTDPKNPKRIRDTGGISFSRFSVPEKTENPESPSVSGMKTTFLYQGSPGQRVYVYGDFNNWDPYMYRMKELPENNYYLITIRISPGRYKYKFIVDGTTLADPLNDEKTVDIFGQTASVFSVTSEF